jgi:hypothetical protein
MVDRAGLDVALEDHGNEYRMFFPEHAVTVYSEEPSDDAYKLGDITAEMTLKMRSFEVPIFEGVSTIDFGPLVEFIKSVSSNHDIINRDNRMTSCP